MYLFLSCVQSPEVANVLEIEYVKHLSTKYPMICKIVRILKNWVIDTLNKMTSEYIEREWYIGLIFRKTFGHTPPQMRAFTNFTPILNPRLAVLIIRKPTIFTSNFQHVIIPKTISWILTTANSKEEWDSLPGKSGCQSKNLCCNIFK